VQLAGQAVPPVAALLCAHLAVSGTSCPALCAQHVQHTAVLAVAHLCALCAARDTTCILVLARRLVQVELISLVQFVQRAGQAVLPVAALLCALLAVSGTSCPALCAQHVQHTAVLAAAHLCALCAARDTTCIPVFALRLVQAELTSLVQFVQLAGQDVRPVAVLLCVLLATKASTCPVLLVQHVQLQDTVPLAPALLLVLLAAQGTFCMLVLALQRVHVALIAWALLQLVQLAQMVARIVPPHLALPATLAIRYPKENASSR